MAYPGLTVIFASFLIFFGQFGYSNGQCADGGCSATDLGSFENLQRDSDPDAQGCYSNNAQVTLTCASPATPEGTSMNTCNSGSWAEGPITCNVYCSPLNKENLIQSPNKTRYEVGNEVTFSCNKGYKLTSNSPTSAHCIESGSLNSTQEPECTAFSCSAPASTDENLSWTDKGEKDTYNGIVLITYSCSDGFKLEGSNNNTCIDQNRWQFEDPTCSAFNCSAPTSTDENLSWTDKGEKDTYNGTEPITYSCSDGLKLEGSNNNTCIDQNRWQFEDPTCSGNVVQVFSYFLLMTTFYSVFSFYM